MDFSFIENPQSLSYHPQGNKGNVTGVSGMLTVIAVFTGLKSEFDSLRSDDGVTCEQKSHPGVHNCGYGRGAREVTYVCSVTAQEDRPYRLSHRGTPYDVQLTGEGGVCVCLKGRFVCLWCECVLSYFNAQMPLHRIHVHVCIVDCASVCLHCDTFVFSFG